MSLLFISVKLGEVDVTRTEALITFIGASHTSVVVLYLTIALLWLSWSGIGFKFGTATLNPSVGFFVSGSPFSHLIKSGDGLFAVWTNFWTNKNSTWTVARNIRSLSLFSALVWLVAFFDRGSQGLILVTNGLPVFLSLLNGSFTSVTELSLKIWIVVQIFLSLLGGELLGTCTKSTLLNTDGGVVGLWIKHSIDVVVTSGVALSIFVIE